LIKLLSFETPQSTDTNRWYSKFNL
jgi:hypothetical protein